MPSGSLKIAKVSSVSLAISTSTVIAQFPRVVGRSGSAPVPSASPAATRKSCTGRPSCRQVGLTVNGGSTKRLPADSVAPPWAASSHRGGAVSRWLARRLTRSLYTAAVGQFRRSVDGLDAETAPGLGARDRARRHAELRGRERRRRLAKRR